MKATYENFFASCPTCGSENIFNRASDLRDLDLIVDRQVNCRRPECRQPFYLSGDVVSPAYEMLIFDCYELLERKHYAYCILNLAQAYEVFFAQYLRVELLYKPSACDPEKDINLLNELMNRLYAKTEKLTFEPMRNLFLRLVLQRRRPASLHEAEDDINLLPCTPGPPPDDDIAGARLFNNRRIPQVLFRLKACKVAALRNQVVHKSAYRPTLDEVNDALRETREVLFVLPRDLGAQTDDLNWYMRRAGSRDASGV
jgi:hypothetical protein